MMEEADLHEKSELREEYNHALQVAIDSGEPYAIVLTKHLTIESVPLRDHDPSLLHEPVEMECGDPNWVINCVGGEFHTLPVDDAFEEAWQAMDYYYESRRKSA